MGICPACAAPGAVMPWRRWEEEQGGVGVLGEGKRGGGKNAKGEGGLL